MSPVNADQESAEKLADAAEEYLARAGVDTPSERIRVATKWSMEGWAAMARHQGLDTPHGGIMRRALEIVTERNQP